MSFPPPGPPMPMPGMPPVPPMMPPPYHPVPPMGGMIPMTVGMMPAPMMTPVAMAVPPSLPMPPHPKSPMKKHIPPMPYKRHEWMNKLREYNKKDFSTGVPSQAPKGPPVTVFVGNITERASDSLIRQILQRCGTVVNWKRVQGANGKLQAFGFCEYGDPESGLRAIRLLHDWQIGEKKLVVKVDAKTKEKLDEYKAAKWANQNKATTTTAETTATTEENKSEEKKEVVAAAAAAADDKGDEIDENTKKEDLLIKGSIDDIIRDHSIELSRPVDSKAADAVETENHLGWLNSFSDKRILKSYQLRKLFTISQNNNANNKETPPAEKQRKSTKPPETQPKSRDENARDSKNDLDEMDLEEEKKSLIHREIDKFRDTYKRAEEEKEKERERKERDSTRDSSSRSRHRDLREKEKERKSSSRRERTPARERDRESERARERERERERTRSPIERNNRGKDKIERLMVRSRSRSRDRGWSQERERSRERSRDKDVEKDREREDEDDAYDRKKMDRKLREKEAAYQERLRNWETRERRKAKDYEKARQKEDDQKQEEAKEARRLKEFLEDYDDERDDPKYYKGSALARRLKEREKEIEGDNHDRRKEKEEIEEVRRQLVEKGHPDPDGELERLHQEEQAKLLQPKAKVEPSDSEGEPEPPLHLPKMKPIVKQEVVEEEVKVTTKHPIEDDNTQNSLSGFSDVITTQEEAKPLGFGVLRLGGSPPTHVAPRSPSTTTTTNSTQSGQKKKISLQDVFNDDDSSEQRKKRKLIPLDDVLEESAKLAGSSQQNMSMEEKRKHIKNLIDKIPTAKEELFAFTLDWSLVDKPLMERKIKPWINKKIVEYIGEEEPTLVDFICSKVLAGSAAQSILDDVSMVLDEEAEVFVVKMWRLLIYEIEAKKLGLMR